MRIPAVGRSGMGLLSPTKNELERKSWHSLYQSYMDNRMETNVWWAEDCGTGAETAEKG